MARLTRSAAAVHVVAFPTGSAAVASSSSSSGPPPVVIAGRRDCLKGLKLVFTGELPSLGRPNAIALARKYGACVPLLGTRLCLLMRAAADAPRFLTIARSPRPHRQRPLTSSLVQPHRIDSRVSSTSKTSTRSICAEIFQSGRSSCSRRRPTSSSRRRGCLCHRPYSRRQLSVEVRQHQWSPLPSPARSGARPRRTTARPVQVLGGPRQDRGRASWRLRALSGRCARPPSSLSCRTRVACHSSGGPARRGAPVDRCAQGR
jgi:hypothetical protein